MTVGAGDGFVDKESLPVIEAMDGENRSQGYASHE